MPTRDNQRIALFFTGRKHAGENLAAVLTHRAVELVAKKGDPAQKEFAVLPTQNGARVGDLYMTLIHTCELCGVNPFDYLTELQRHDAEVTQTPAQWLPWSYRDTLTRDGGPAS